MWYPCAAIVAAAAIGYTDSRGQQCDEGTYNTGGNRNPCTPCGYGLTSVAGSDEASDCRLAPGFARVAGVATECPQGRVAVWWQNECNASCFS